MKQGIINLAVFKAAWIAVVVNAAVGVPVVGVVAVAIAVWVHLRSCDNVKSEIQLLLVAAAMGFAWESTLVLSGLLNYPTGNVLPGMAPYWIVAMWVLFATTINVGLRWLRRNRAVAATAGAIGGPMGFLAGAGMGAVELTSPVIALLCIGIGWAALLPLLVHIAMRLQQVHVA
jgi:hypothetical protein